jgi:serine phosphatase RsbU (regulator of sigma subunit)
LEIAPDCTPLHRLERRPRGKFRATPAIAVESLRLPPDALLVLYTDGLVEFERNVFTGEAALRTAWQSKFAQRLTKPAHAILDQGLAGRSADDDIALLTLSIEPGIGR